MREPDPASLSQAVTEVARAMLGRAIAAQAALRTPGANSALTVAAAEVARLLGGGRDGTDDDVRATLAAHDAAVTAAHAAFARWLPVGAPRFEQLRRRAGLTADDLAILAALLAPELDVEFERAYAYVMDDFSRKRPDLGLLARLLGTDLDAARATVRRRLAWDAPLRAARLVLVGGGDDQGPASHRPVRVADRLLAHLQGDDRPDERIANAVRLLPPGALDDLVLDAEVVTAIDRTLAPHSPGQAPSRLLLVGRAGSGRAAAVAAIAARTGRAAMRIDVAALATDVAALAEPLALALRDALLRDAVVVLDGEELPADLPRRTCQAIAELLDTCPLPIVLAWPTRAAWLSASIRDLAELEVKLPTFAARVELWRRNLPPSLPAAAIETLASRYTFTPAGIAQAARRASSAARLRSPDAPVITLDDLGAAAQLQFGNRLGSVAQRIPTGFSWSDLVLPADTATAVKEFITFARRRAFLLEEWGFAKKLPYGRGVSAILAGPPGTGKTMVAQLLAKELGYDLYRIDLSQVVNKYIGETEKNLARIFDEAETSHAVLFFDEADALFAKRTEVKSSNDRYANLEVNYLLQRMETFDGCTLLATNLEQGLDEAFKRRVRFSIQFEVPEADERRRLWQSMFPPETPLAPNIDWDRLGKTFEMAGGYIKKAAVRAAMIAADAEPRRAITTADLLEAGRYEYREMGRIVAG